MNDRTENEKTPAGLLAVDRLVVAYLAITAALAMFGGTTGLAIAAVHVVLCIFLLRMLAKRPLPSNRWLLFLRIAYPVAMTPLLYMELGTLNQFVFPGYHDDIVQGWEQALFGVQLSMDASVWFDDFTLSELMHLGYASYYLLVPASLIGAYRARGAGGLERTSFAIAFAFFICYAIFAVFPVAGPRYFFEPIGGAIAEGRIHDMVHVILEGGSSKGTAFPSSHIAAAATAVLAAGREDRRWLWLLAIPVLFLALGTVYGRFHYGIDAVAGALVAVVAWQVTPRLMARLGTAIS